jgi:hypothetical protein
VAELVPYSERVQAVNLAVEESSELVAELVANSGPLKCGLELLEQGEVQEGVVSYEEEEGREPEEEDRRTHARSYRMR